MKTITIIDTFAFFFRAYFALPPLKSRDSFPTGLLTGFINFIHQLQREHATDYIIFALDSERSFRKEIYPLYKANRPTPPEDLMKQLPIAISWIEKMGFANISIDGYEADDVIASVAKRAKESNIQVKIVSSDKDLYQLLDDRGIFLYDWVKKILIDEKKCVEKFGVEPRDFVDFQALVGDSSDNVPGVAGIGLKSASKLINEYKNLENIYANIDEISPKRVQKLLIEGKENAFLSRELVRLKDDILKDLDFEKFKFEDRNYLEMLKDEFIKYDMNQALRWAQDSLEPKYLREQKSKINNIKFKTHILTNKEKLLDIINNISKDEIVSFDTETDSLDTNVANIIGFSFSFDRENSYYVPIAHNYLGVEEQLPKEDAKDILKLLLSKKIVGQNIKFDLEVIYKNFNLNRVEPFGDSMILAWLLEPGSKVGLDFLAKKFLNYNMQSYSDTVKKGEDFSSVDIKSAAFYASEDAFITRELYFKLIDIFKNAKLDELLKEAKEVEFPFINVLVDMEMEGIKVDINYLSEFKKELEEEIEKLTLLIYKDANMEFNIKSTQQLSKVLFEHLGLKGIKKTKSGYSTNESVLESLKDKHPIIEKILKYREMQKILSTYITPLLRMGKKDKNHRIRSSFLQTGTSTGRLSSKNPNLQNIPVRTSLGKRVRRAFIAKDGYSLVSIDYSQIELRLLAHFSQDRALMEAFINNEDIHLSTAIKLFGKERAKEMRDFAKSINFGLLYGMGPRKLAGELKISQKEAKEIIEAYFNTFPTVKNYLSSIEEFVKQNGYIETLLKRRRVFNLDNANAMVKSAILREAVNSVFQGSAADLIKLAMLDIDSLIYEENLDAKILLQIHDELIFEIKESEANKIANRFKYLMENIYPLNIPLKCSVSIGKSWDTLK
ncbi:MAG: DNA polymerase I [Epsilonproteobacteria bacterium]|nr:DNA polymerase I [Campylobacterota bacterium]